MSLFLKRNKKNKGVYLQICDSVYDRTLGYGTHKVTHLWQLRAKNSHFSVNFKNNFLSKILGK